MRLLHGNGLTPTQREQAEDIFRNRWLAIGKGKRYRNEDAWFDDHAFWAYNNGRLAMDASPESIQDLDHDFSREYIARVASRSIPYMSQQEMILEIKKYRAFTEDGE
jgi:hypothetical protein